MRFFVVAGLIALHIVVVRDAWGVYPLAAVLLVLLGYDGPWPPWTGTRRDRSPPE